MRRYSGHFKFGIWEFIKTFYYHILISVLPNIIQCTIVDGGPVIMAKIFGVFGTKTCSFIKENRTKNGPLVFCTVLCSKHDEKLGNWERKTLREVVGCGIVRFRSIFLCQMLELARNHMVLLLGKLCDRNLYSTINFTEITGSAMFKWHLFWLDFCDF